MPPLHLFIKPASGTCNLRCNYCFYSDIMNHRRVSSYGIMSEETLKELILKAFAYAEEECTLSFQGGEPTLAGLSFYRKCIALCKEYNQTNLKLHFAIQTNGYQLSEEWIAFLTENHFLVGISLDGTLHTHNAFRHTPEGKDTFYDIMNTIQLLQSYQTDFNILTVVNKKTAANVDKIYRFYLKNKFEYLQFIPCLDPFQAIPGSMEYSLTNEGYASFLCRLFDLWYTDFKAGRGISIRLFDNYLSLLIYGYAEACDMNGICSMQHVVEADGSVYPCDFYVMDSYCLGNITMSDLTAINQKRKEISFIEASEKKPKACLSCEYFALCRGGCMRYQLKTDENEPPKNILCSAYHQFFTYSLPRLKELAQLVKKVL